VFPVASSLDSKAVVPKLNSVAPRGAPVVYQGCLEILWTGLLLTKESQITPTVSDFLCILLQTDCKILKITALTTYICHNRKKNLYIPGGEKNGVPAIILHTVLGCRGREKFENYCSAVSALCGSHTSLFNGALFRFMACTIAKYRNVTLKTDPITTIRFMKNSFKNSLNKAAITSFLNLTRSLCMIILIRNCITSVVEAALLNKRRRSKRRPNVGLRPVINFETCFFIHFWAHNSPGRLCVRLRLHCFLAVSLLANCPSRVMEKCKVVLKTFLLEGLSEQRLKIKYLLLN